MNPAMGKEGGSFLASTAVTVDKAAIAEATSVTTTATTITDKNCARAGLDKFEQERTLPDQFEQTGAARTKVSMSWLVHTYVCLWKKE